MERYIIEIDFIHQTLKKWRGGGGHLAFALFTHLSFHPLIHLSQIPCLQDVSGTIRAKVNYHFHSDGFPHTYSYNKYGIVHFVI